MVGLVYHHNIYMIYKYILCTLYLIVKILYLFQIVQVALRDPKLLYKRNSVKKLHTNVSNIYFHFSGYSVFYVFLFAEIMHYS